jgi:hypothetical protein
MIIDLMIIDFAANAGAREHPKQQIAKSQKLMAHS